MNEVPLEDAELLLRFEDDREHVVQDLLRRTPLGLRRIVDLGCGPGTSTRLLIERYPQARITAVDLSEAMLAVAAERAARKSSGSAWRRTRSRHLPIDRELVELRSE